VIYSPEHRGREVPLRRGGDEDRATPAHGEDGVIAVRYLEFLWPIIDVLVVLTYRQHGGGAFA
jgi:hypothetical protein